MARIVPLHRRIPPTHTFHGQWPVAVREIDDRTVEVTYVGPDVPGNRSVGDVRRASRFDFNGKPTLVAIPPTGLRLPRGNDDA